MEPASLSLLLYGRYLFHRPENVVKALTLLRLRLWAMDCGVFISAWTEHKNQIGHVPLSPRLKLVWRHLDGSFAYNRSHPCPAPPFGGEKKGVCFFFFGFFLGFFFFFKRTIVFNANRKPIF